MKQTPTWNLLKNLQELWAPEINKEIRGEKRVKGNIVGRSTLS